MMTDKRPIVETDLIDFDATKQAFRIKLDAAKRVVGYALDAKKMMGDPKNKGLYDYRFDEFDNILYDLKNGNIELEDFVTFDWDKDYTAGKPFVDLHPIPPIELEVKTVSQFKKLTEEEKKRSLTTLKEGKEIKSSSDVKSYGDYDEFVDLVTNNILASDKSAWYAGWIINKLTPEQKIQAVNDYPFDDVSVGQMKYYYKNVANDVFEKHLAPDVVSGLDIKPEKKTKDEEEDKEPQVRTIEIPGTNLKFNNAVDLSTIPDTESQKRSLSGFILPKGAMKITGKDGATTTEKSFPELKKQGDYIIDWYDLKEGFIQVHSTDKYGRLQYYLVPIKKNEYILSKIKSFKTPEPSEEKNKVNEVVRMTKDGREAIFDADTKEFIRYAR